GFFPPQSGWAMHTGYQLSMGMFKSTFFGYPTWTPANVVGWGDVDFCFQLTAAPSDHDVGVTEIKHPTDLDTPGCPCIPVEVEVSNMGIHDESNVPVTVEVHRNLMCTSFPADDYNMEWNFDPPCPPGNWQFVMAETWFPYRVTPVHGDWMAEFNQHGCVDPEVAEMRTHYPINLCGDCIDPYLKFYFWHDDYGSDDYMDVWVSTEDKYGYYEKVGGPYERLICPECPEGWKEYRISLEEFICNDIWIMFKGHCDGTPSAYNLFVDYVCVFDLEYQETKYIDIDVGEVKQVEFPCWPGECWWCQYENDDVLFHVGAWTEMEGDGNPANDGFGPYQWLYKPVWIHIPWTHDVGDKEIKEPAEDYYMQQPLEMVQTIKNYGKEPESCFNVYMQVRDLTKVTKLDEHFNNWEDNPPPDGSGSSSDDRPVGWRDYGTNYYYDYGWEDMNSNYAGGASGPMEARLYYGYIVDYTDMVLESPSINTLGEGKLELVFNSMINNFAGGYYCTVEARADPGDPWENYTPWDNPITTSIPAEQYTVDITPEIGYDTQVKFNFWGYGWNLNYWYIDDVKLISYTCGEELYYSEKVCVDDIGVCQDLDVPFPDWTPDPPYDCYCGIMEYCVISYTKMLDPPDQNAANDMKMKFITVEFLHDVAIKEFTEPVYEIGALDWIQYTDETPENALGLTGPGTICEAIKLTPAELGAYTNHEITKIRVYKGYPGYTFEHAYEVWMYTGAQPTDPDDGTVVATGTSPIANGWFEIDTDAYAFDPADTVWVGVTWDHPSAGTFPCGMDDSVYIPGKSSWFIYDVGSGWAGWMEYGPYSMMIGAGVEAAGGNGEVPEPDIYIPCEEQEFWVMIENLGTYDEDATVIWTFYEYTPDKEVVAFDDGFVVPIDAGDEEVVYLFTYDFEDKEGVYEVEVEVTIPVDCNPDNNGPINLVVGADCCGPESCFVLNPEYPNGLNNWFISPITVTVDAWDLCEVQSGIEKIVYIIDGVMGEISGAHGTFVIDGDGVHFVEIYAVDKVGNEEKEHRTFEVAIDTTAPTVDLVHESYQDDDGNWMVDFTATANDVTSGMNRVEFKIDAVLDLTLYVPPYEWTVIWEDGYKTKTFYAYAYDDAGNSAEDHVAGGDIKSITANSQSQSQSQSVTVKRVVTLTLGR
ncbi:MAG: hypothetical protein KAW45_08725, partial [Thermoplasmatales archaeon]|nr:hypothetical protein [Thermoplasmatales archaeon]